ncbi:hypothetical protein [Sporosalibacterium faouarense]|uniref:hypothetical protein n=1 Tax=Sporosalibacterium faouarense TaxID=516123 RepID=UPI00141D451F|nr:hypothetical protein [Sporosalibacterium faouarense]MTI47912.1 hypothetical protein [Bacillota bacterium]
MKKRKIVLVVLIIIVLISILITAYLSQNKDDEIELGKYIMQDSEKPAPWAWVVLKENNEFEFMRSLATSYIPRGTYSINDNILTLYANEDETYIFTIDEGNLIFQSGKYAVRMIEKGTVFKLSNKE